MTLNEVVDYAELNYGMVWPPDYIVEVPCGYCFSCQKSSNNQYRIRLMYEIRKWPPNTCLFVTLTFDDENLIKYQDNPNKAVRLFLDRMRKRFGKQIRHWFIGEYGTKKVVRIITAFSLMFRESLARFILLPILAIIPLFVSFGSMVLSLSVMLVIRRAAILRSI